MIGVDYGFVLVVLDPATGDVRPLHGTDRTAWLAGCPATRAEVPPASASTVDVPMRLAELPWTPPTWWPLALCALLRVRLARRGRCGFGRLLGLVTRSRRRSVRRATVTETTQALAAVRRLARLFPAGDRALDECVAAVVMLGWRGADVRLRHGVTIDPLRVHTWLEVDDRPVSEPESVARYTPFPRSVSGR